MNRITQKLRSLAAQNKKALACFITAGYPTVDATVQFVREIENGGADIIEIGMPFSDPLAEGPIIQQSSQVALSQGINLDIIFSQVRAIRANSNIPIVLMGYLNPILSYGEKKFLTSASKAGVDGLVLPELTYEESGRYRSVFESTGLGNILLVTPTTPPKRIAKIDKASSGFLYCVSTTGVTGSSLRSTNINYISKVKKSAKKNPVLVGFGIKTPEDAKRIAQHADGVIVGSEIIRKMINGETPEQIGEFVKQLKEAI
jgi:tryptophan synthase alpha chain